MVRAVFLAQSFLYWLTFPGLQKSDLWEFDRGKYQSLSALTWGLNEGDLTLSYVVLYLNYWD